MVSAGNELAAIPPSGDKPLVLSGVDVDVVVSVVSWPIDVGPRHWSPMLLLPIDHYGFSGEKPRWNEWGLLSVDGVTRQQGTF